MIDIRSEAAQILKLAGGKENILSLTHCFTRIRLVLKDTEAADSAEIQSLEGVQGIMRRSDSYQIVIGTEAAGYYKELALLCRSDN